MADSSLDYIARKIAIHYLGWDELAHYKPERTEEEKQQFTIEMTPTGYTGNSCEVCKSFEMRRTGTCLTCENCGANTGCS